MKSVKYIEFKEKYLPEIYQRFYLDTITYMKNEYGRLSKILQKQMENVLETIYQLQTKAPFQVGCIQGSYLLSSLIKGNPEMMYEVYGEGKDFGTLIMARTESAEWLLPYWDTLQNDIREKISELHWERFLGEEEVKTLVLEGMMGIFVQLAYQFKYVYRDFENWAKASQIQTEEDFYVSLGEYRGWKRVLYMRRTVKDIFMEIQEKEFQFMNFEDCIYEDKRFLNKKFTSASFTNCLFLSCTFKGVDFTDCQLQNCVFRKCVFENCTMSGCEFDTCDMQRVEWKTCDFTSGTIMNENGLSDMCRMAGFYHSILHKHTFTHTDLADCIVQKCNDEDIVMDKECVFADSDFQKLMGRNGNYEVL